jgi:hypothetical protein
MTWLKLAAGPLALLLAPDLASAQISTTNIRPLAFGKFIAGSGGTVSIAPDGSRSTAGVLLLPSQTSSADFLLRDTNSDNASKQVLVELPPNGTVVLNSGGNSMPLTGLSSNLPSTARLMGGSMALSVGASLVVGPNQPPGNYTGSIPVTVTVVYQ